MGNTPDKKAKKKKAEQAAKMQKSIVTIVAVVMGLIIAGLIAWIVIYSTSFSIKETNDYSIGLNDDGKIADVKATDYVELCDYKNIEIKSSDVSVTDEEIQSYKDSLLSEYMTYDSDEERVIEMGDEINIDYVGSIGGVEFEGGSTRGAGTNIVVGQAGYIDDFEEQLCGHKKGEEFSIEVTFPDDYGNAEVAGKDATFAIKINGIFKNQEFNDEFVQAHLSDQARTADAFIQQYKDSERESRLMEYLQTYLVNNSEIKSYPETYIKGLMGLVKGSDIQQYESYNKNYQETYGAPMYTSFEEYTGTDKKEYYASCRTQAEDLAKQMLVYQAIYEDAGLTMTEEDRTAALASYGIDSTYMAQMEETYGKGFVNQSAIMFTVLNHVKENVTIVE